MKHLFKAVLVLCVSAAVLAPSSVQAARVACGEVPYTPGSTVASSHYGAQSVTADGTSCITARRLALRAKNRGAFSYLGFSCTYRGTVNSKPWRCYRPSPRALVTFITTGS